MLNPQLFAALSGGNQDMSAQSAATAPALGSPQPGAGPSLFALMQQAQAPQSVAFGGKRHDPNQPPVDPKSNPYDAFMSLVGHGKKK
jgi:hypothetical protein